MLEKALRGARLLYAYTIHVEAPLEETFKYMGEPERWTRDYNGDPVPNLVLEWDGAPYKAGSVMALETLRKDGTPNPQVAIRMELLRYARDEELSFRFLLGNHLIYRFVFEEMTPFRTEFTVNVLVDAQSSLLNTLQQRLYAGKRRKASIRDHLRVKAELEARAARRR